MLDKVGCYFDWDEIEIISPNQADKRHHYLFRNSAKETSYYHTGDDYFPTVRNTPYGIYWESCPSKVLFGHNLYEISSEDLMPFVEKSIKQLAYAGVFVDSKILLQHRLFRLDINKLVLLPLMPHFCMRLTAEANKVGRFQKGITYYPTKGMCLFNTLNYRKLLFYDKVAEGKNQQILPQELLELLNSENLTLINVEYQMQKAPEFEREYQTQGLIIANTLENAFNPTVARTILGNRVAQALEGIIHIEDIPLENLIHNTELACKDAGINGLQSISTRILLVLMLKNFGPFLTYDWISSNTDRSSAYRYWKGLKTFCANNSTQEILFKDTIQSSINSMNPMRLESYRQFHLCNCGEFPTQCVGNTTKPLEQQGGENNGSTFSVC